jgi:hypothetical protein
MILLALILLGFPATAAVAEPLTLNYSAEWRGLRAGSAQLTVKPGAGQSQADLHVETVGFAAKLYKVDMLYTSVYDGSYCASALSTLANEGKKRRETKVQFQQPPGSATLVERDLIGNTVVASKSIAVPPCVHDLMASMGKLRSMKLEVGKSFELPLSDGKKSIQARVAVNKREKLRIHSATYETLQVEAFLHNGVFYRKKGRLLIWLSDDEKRLPVRIQVQQPFWIGTVTIDLEN